MNLTDQIMMRYLEQRQANPDGMKINAFLEKQIARRLAAEGKGAV
ncbi:MAG TPA: hypothetical protein PL051_00135 [Candidatus Saccharibacteria bacterium]|nr:hypothetical protein [Candidatus Saccharibacteria bacterium]